MIETPVKRFTLIALDNAARCTRWTAFQGMCVRHEVTMESGAQEVWLVEWGVADTYFSCPAKASRRGEQTRYGHVTWSDPDDQDVRKMTFTESDIRANAKASYRESIQP